jgi:hypothetical protein
MRKLGEDFILTTLLWVVVIVGFIIIAILWSNNIVNAAYTLSDWVTKDQITQAEELGAIQRTTLEVQPSYGEQITVDVNRVQGSRNE